MRRRGAGVGAQAESGEALSIWRDLQERLGLLAAIGVEEAQGSEEEGLLDLCLERLGILIALREAPPDPPLPRGLSQSGLRSVSVCSSLTLPLTARSSKKRRLENSNNNNNNNNNNSNQNISIPINTVTNFTSNNIPSSSHSPLPPSASLDSPPSRPTSPLPPSRSPLSTPLSDLPPSAKPRPAFRLDRRVTLRDQLPLHPGRLVAFRPPKRPSDASRQDEWIMAKVVKCISGDKNRYEVEDVDEVGRGLRRASWNTTLKSVVPLPMIHLPQSYPPTPLLPGTFVLALYPETTTFYRGIVKSSPLDKSRNYQILFEDDEGTGPVSVVMEHVVPIL